MLWKFTNPSIPEIKILEGGDTDVSRCMIVKYSPDTFIVTITYMDDNEGKSVIKPEVYHWTRADFQKQFDLQYGSPMQYINQSSFNWMVND